MEEFMTLMSDLGDVSRPKKIYKHHEHESVNNFEF